MDKQIFTFDKSNGYRFSGSNPSIPYLHHFLSTSFSEFLGDNQKPPTLKLEQGSKDAPASQGNSLEWKWVGGGLDE